VNKLRSLLTALGIIFGVAAVIAMLAIGNGAKKELLEQIELVGVNNIVITPIIDQVEGEVVDVAEQSHDKYSPGLTLQDAESIATIIGAVESVSPEIIIETNFVRSGYRRSGKLVGVEPSFFKLSDFTLTKGKMFTEQHSYWGDQVCIIGHGVKTKFFSQEDPIGKYIKAGPIWLMVVGVLEEKHISDKAISNLGIRNFNMDVFAPIKTVLIRYKNRSLVTQYKIEAGMNSDDEDGGSSTRSNYHQIDRLVVTVARTEDLTATADIIRRMIERRHLEVIDFEISIPEELLKQQQRTKDIFNIVLGAIASISLLIGGIGIMNIMLASVLERIKEIGIRLSIGARKEDVVLQFVMEAVLISISGGLIGIVLGILFSELISNFSDIETIVSWVSVIVSFTVAAAVGLVFGIALARKAASQDPVVSLRHE